MDENKLFEHEEIVKVMTHQAVGLFVTATIERTVVGEFVIRIKQSSTYGGEYCRLSMPLSKEHAKEVRDELDKYINE